MEEVLALIDEAGAVLLNVGIGSVDDEAILGSQDLELKVEDDDIFGEVVDLKLVNQP